MLPRSRVISILLVGLGAALLVAGLMLPKWVPSTPAMPSDLEHTTLMMHDGRRDLRRQIHAQFIQPADREVQSLRVGSSLTKGEGELINARVWTYTIDRITGEPTGPARLADQPLAVGKRIEMGGPWLKFPAGAGERTYPIFDETVEGPVDAVFVGAEDREGTIVHHYRQTIERRPLAAAVPMGEGEAAGEARLHYEGTRDWWVEPVSGFVIDMAEDTRQYWLAPEGVEGELPPPPEGAEFTGEMPRELTEQLLAQAERVADTPATGPWGIALAVVGAIVAVVGVIGALRPGRAN